MRHLDLIFFKRKFIFTNHYAYIVIKVTVDFSTGTYNNIKLLFIYLFIKLIVIFFIKYFRKWYDFDTYNMKIMYSDI